jgi:hypothetical protein
MGDETTAAVGMGVGAARLMELFMDNVLVDAIISNRYLDLNLSTWGAPK